MKTAFEIYHMTDKSECSTIPKGSIVVDTDWVAEKEDDYIFWADATADQLQPLTLGGPDGNGARWYIVMEDLPILNQVCG